MISKLAKPARTLGPDEILCKRCSGSGFWIEKGSVCFRCNGTGKEALIDRGTQTGRTEVSTIKSVYIVTDMDFVPNADENCLTTEFKTERSAIKAATERLSDSEGDDAEVWVWKLTHVLSKPDLDPIIEIVK
jgi:hypothetical protein